MKRGLTVNTIFFCKTLNAIIEAYTGFITKTLVFPGVKS